MNERFDWHFSWLTKGDEVWAPSFIAQWRKWIDNSPNAHVFFEPSMVRMWSSYYQTREQVEPRFMIAEHASGGKVFFPLVCVRYGWKDAWYRVLQPAGGGHFDYLDPIFTEHCGNQICASFWKAFIENVRKYYRRAVDQVIIQRVREPYAGAYNGFFEYSRAPFINLRDVESIDTVLSKCSGKFRHEVRRRIRRIEELGVLRLRVYNRDEIDSAQEALDGLICAYKAKWKAGKKVGSFYRSMLSACLPKGFLHISTLESDGTAISWHMGFFYKHRFYDYKPTYDMTFANYSPGKVHLVKLIEESLHLGAHVFDFLRGEETYKYKWTQSSIALHQMRIETPGLRSKITRNTRRILWANRNKIRKIRKCLS